MARYITDGLFAVFNVSENKQNYSQRNNLYRTQNGFVKVNAFTECNVTSMCMAADYAGYHFPKGDFAQAEDNFAKFLNESPIVDAYYKEKMPAMYADWKAGKKDAFPPNEVHAVLSYGFNQWIGCKATSFILDYPINSMLKDLSVSNRPLVLSGKFGKLNHIVTLVGFKVPVAKVDNFTFDDVVEFIIDDPYGDYHDGYAGTKAGNDIVMSKADFLSIFKPLNDDKVKWAHIFYAPAAIV